MLGCQCVLLRYCSLLFVTLSLLFVTVRYCSLLFVTVRYLLRYSPLLCRFYNVKKMQILQTLKKAEYSVAHTSPKLGQGVIRLPPMAFSENINSLLLPDDRFCIFTGFSVKPLVMGFSTNLSKTIQSWFSDGV